MTGLRSVAANNWRYRRPAFRIWKKTSKLSVYPYETRLDRASAMGERMRRAALAVAGGAFAFVLASVLVFIHVVPGFAQPRCDADPGWLPTTPPPASANPNSPDDDCPFYQAAWQHFLFVTATDATGSPAFFAYKGITDLFGRTASPMLSQALGARLLNLLPRVAERPHEGPVAGQRFVGSPVVGSDIFQAGVRGLLIDQRGHPIFFGIHVNQAFDDFLTANRLKTVPGLLFARPDLAFPRGAVELKSAWQLVDDNNPPADFITAKAVVPVLSVQNGQLVVSKDRTRTVTVALLSLHVVFVLDGHSEFIWSTFEHADAAGDLDLTPSAPANPGQTSDATVISSRNFILYKANTVAGAANVPLVTQQAATGVSFDEVTQTFKTTTGATAQTSVYRAYPGSQSDEIEVDDEVVVLNKSVGGLFNGSDRRSHYRLAGAVWLQHPEQSFKLDVRFSDTDLQGENRLSGVALESFTQDQNCFACHSTKTVKNDVTSNPIVSAKLTNVSHVISKFLASEPPTFDDVKSILDHALQDWTAVHGTPPDLSGHGQTFKWGTKAELLAAVGHGKQLVQSGLCGSGQARNSNLIVDLRTGLPQRMPKGGPFLDEAAIQRIEDWINSGCQ
jgi:hypothetical protein